ncbi:MAG: putative membrane protein [Cocleimonas sp.]|jgi:uncharacterized membrane protein
MKFLFAFVFFVVAVMMSFSLASREWQVAFIGIATILGFLFGQVQSLTKQLKELRESLAKDWEERNKLSATQTTSSFSNEALDHQSKPIKDQVLADTDNSTSVLPNNEDYLDLVNQAAASVEADQTGQNTQATNWESTWNTAEPVSKKHTKDTEGVKVDSLRQTPRGSTVTVKLTAKVKSYFTGGNIFVRIGIIILFFGISFLLKYVSDRGFFPIEYRLIAVVIGAIFLLGLGWRLRHKNETYALLLQGAGIGVLYLDIFAAYNLYQLIPPIAAFVLLFVVSMFSAALAVLQDSKSLAVLGFSGGFLAPILASSDSNNHIGLFSYYAVLNVAIVAIAWFKAWRELNLLGFAFTFIIGTVWGVLSYNSAKLSTTEPFLILFFVFYVLIAVLYALRQPLKLRGYVDGTLLFGVPLAASTLQYYLVKDFEYGVSISSFTMGLFYMLLSWFIWKRKGDGLKLLAEAFLALGVIFASMAIPFALAPTQTAAAWALEGAGFIWLGSRQNRLSVRTFGMLLQIAAGVIFLARYNYVPDTRAFINSEFISSMMLAVAGILSALLLIKPFKGQKQWETLISPLLLVWGILWLIGGFAFQMLEHFRENFLPSAMMIFSASVSLFLGVLAMRTKPLWKHAFAAAFILFLVIILMAIGQFALALFSSSGGYHPLIWYGWLAWTIVFGVYYFLLHQSQKHDLYPRFQILFHSVLLLLAVFLITYEGGWWIFEKLGIQSAWLVIWFAIPATLSMWLIIKAKIWPFSSHKESFRRYSGSVLAVLLSLWLFGALIDKGISDPLPWIPVINPLDIMVLIIFITLFKWWQSTNGFSFQQADNSSSISIKSTNKRQLFNKRLFVMGFAGLTFLWLNFTLFRISYHWFDIPYNESAMYASSLVQTSVSILWAFTGVVLTLFASRKNNRLLWVIGAVLLGLVVLKLFVIDLSALGSLGRIISFLVVGALLTSIGYFAPLPDKDDDVVDNTEVTELDKVDKENKKNSGDKKNA